MVAKNQLQKILISVNRTRSYSLENSKSIHWYLTVVILDVLSNLQPWQFYNHQTINTMAEWRLWQSYKSSQFVLVLAVAFHFRVPGPLTALYCLWRHPANNNWFFLFIVGTTLPLHRSKFIKSCILNGRVGSNYAKWGNY